jgi:hypothetical protein
MSARETDAVLGVHELCDADRLIGLRKHYPSLSGTNSENATIIHVDTNVVYTLSAFGSALQAIDIKINELSPFFDARSPGLAARRRPPVFPAQPSMRNVRSSR